MDARHFNVGKPRLEALAERIDVASVLPELLALAEGYHELEVVGLEYVARDGPQVLVGNLCFTPVVVDGVGLSEHSVIIFHILARHLNRPARVLAHRKYYMPRERARRNAAVYERMGYVPATIDNGISLLEQNETVLLFPESINSRPPYRLRPFFWGFVRMAWTQAVPVVPLVFTGSRESRPCVERDGRAPPVEGPRHHVPYRLEFLPPVYPRAVLANLDDGEAVSRLCEQVRQSMQRAIQAVVEGRESYENALRLQRELGDTQ